mmetsp:Transcript_16398/g.24465  ORF Transcript_16398/g.24465 Transcript_16398/m.24465 type:complete len:778 (-) Transcript_16398:650-2983(-)|eukprot:CAMPEP_0201551088 /NCGR_PEP_ID=MMETSP0173_2-20130828/7326_1 /ASSEMBLY_ACC=CAM_ASM_000268 /TAXON_ID=218659 /ORGANISM="Vexillifera sp., Strain DIVA3 564/2" /LENGTH=777 /DNA_ID=CAMNT_0047961251 /DNA_START=21 /DNA_END=2354 /DNA_ORIENTATION=+
MASESSPNNEKIDLSQAAQIIGSNDQGEDSFQDSIGQVMGQWGVLNQGFDYKVVAILGPQSSGKSTLLNLLFGTTFDVLDADVTRQQTTKGIWVSNDTKRESNETPIIVLDVEGTDGRERGDDMKFERQSSLFSLVLAPVLIINMWYQDVGRWGAANMTLLRTVLELNLQLFQANKDGGAKTLLLFVIRDHVKTPVEQLASILTTDMNKLWGEIVKPKQFENSSVTDFFEFSFKACAHKLYQEDQFYKDVHELRYWFTDPSNDNYLYKNDKYAMEVPVDGFVRYAKDIWDVISNNKDLDIPKQQTLLAQFRCNEIVNEVITEFENTTMAPLVSSITEKEVIVDDFGTTVSTAMLSALEKYDHPASRYEKAVNVEFRQKLTKQMLKEVQSLFKDQVLLIAQHMRDVFHQQLKDALVARSQSSNSASSSSDSTMDWFGFASKLQQDLVEQFDQHVSESQFQLDSDELYWAVSNDRKAFQKYMSEKLDEARLEEMNKHCLTLKDKFSKDLNRVIGPIVDQSASDMWTSIRKYYQQLVEDNIEFIGQQLTQSFGANTQEVQERVGTLKDQSFQSFFEFMKRKSGFAPYKMKKAFDEQFSMENGVPRTWDGSEDLEKIYTEAKEKATHILDQLSFIRFEEDHERFCILPQAPPEKKIGVPEENILLSPDECDKIQTNFDQSCRLAFHEARKSQQASESQINLKEKIMIALIMFLGFDELLTVITSPFLLIFTVIIAVVVFIVYKLGLFPAIKPIVYKIFNQLGGTVSSLVKGGQQEDHAKID